MDPMSAPIVVSVQDGEAEARRDSQWDAVLLIGPSEALGSFGPASGLVQALRDVDTRASSQVSFAPAPELAGGRLVVSPTGPLNRDYDDVRRFADAARVAAQRARDAGARKPLMVLLGVPSTAAYAHALEVALLGALDGLWEPLEARVALGEGVVEPVESIGFAAGAKDGDAVASWVNAVELGRRLSRDLGGTEPESMRPEGFAAYCREAFAGTNVEVSVVSDVDVLRKDYPLLSAVARASLAVDRHRPRVVRLTYTPEGDVTETLMFAGKGVTYDTGGADLKTGGHMAGMSRDKGGAASVAGFLRTVAALAPRGIKVVAELGAVRNSVGPDSFVTDEIIPGHAGVRVRIGNTDAEGRLVLADILSHLRTQAANTPKPRVFSVATLTGHAVIAMGQYSVAMDNGPAADAETAQTLSRVGDAWGDPFEISRLRRDDYDFVKPRSRADDVISCNNAPSSGTPRGHQFPGAFLAIASGLDKHGRDGSQPVPFTHIDIGGSYTVGSDWQHGRPTAAPVAALAAAFLR